MEGREDIKLHCLIRLELIKIENRVLLQLLAKDLCSYIEAVQDRTIASEEQCLHVHLPMGLHCPLHPQASFKKHKMPPFSQVAINLEAHFEDFWQCRARIGCASTCGRHIFRSVNSSIADAALSSFLTRQPQQTVF